MLMSKLLKPHPEYASYASISGKLPAHFAAEFSTIEVLELLLNGSKKLPAMDLMASACLMKRKLPANNLIENE
jgi:hypothetical protein